MSKRKGPKNALDCIFSSDTLLLLPPIPFGAVCRFYALWWRAGCPELPGSYDYKTGMSLRSCDWHVYNVLIMLTVKEIEPNLVKCRRTDVKTLEARRKFAENARIGLAKKRARIKMPSVMLSDEKVRQAVTLPPQNFRENSTLHNGRFDHVEREKAIEKSKNSDGTLLVDS